MEGEIWLVIGPMYSGKTTTLFDYLKHFADKKCILLKYALDNRYGNEEVVVSHDLVKHKALCVKNLDIELDYDVICIDEGQFFPDIVNFCEKCAALGKKVIVSALSGDYKREPFPNISNLISKAERIIHKRAICGCSKNAAFSFRLTEERDVVLLGGADKYKPVCRACFFRLK